jgi:hypothetical protein
MNDILWQQKAKENNVQSEEVQDEVARACMELLRAEGSPIVQSTEYEPSHQVIQHSIHLEFGLAINLIRLTNIWQDDRNSPLTFERAAELMLAESGAGNCEGRVHVEFLARPLQLLAHMENGSCSPGNLILHKLLMMYMIRFVCLNRVFESYSSWRIDGGIWIVLHRRSIQFRNGRSTSE